MNASADETIDPGPGTPGPTDSLLDVGLRVGQAALSGPGALSGVTVVLAGDEGAVGGVDVRGGGPGTRETDLLDPRNVVERVHAVCLSGGSAFGLASADGVMAALFEAGVGLPMGAPGEVVPLVPAAVVFDLGRGGDFASRPGPDLGRAAYLDALRGEPVRQGCVGAGTGATAGGFKGGVGTASVVVPGGATVAALVVCNALGEVIGSDGLPFAADTLTEADATMLPTPTAASLDRARREALERAPGPVGRPGMATTIGVIATDATLTKAQCAKLAGIGHDGLARAVRPAHTMLDGDTLFGLSTTRRPAPDLVGFHAVLTAAADVVARAVVRAVLFAETTTTGGGAWRSYRDAFG